MLSEYFHIKTGTEDFKANLNNILKDYADKKVLIYGAGEGFLNLKKKFPFNKLNIVAIVDKKFTEQTMFQNFKAIPPENIIQQDYDAIIVTNEYSKPILDYLKNKLNIKDKEIVALFNQEIDDERNLCNYLGEYNFSKTLPKLVKKLKNKKVIIYGSGLLFQVAQNYYDMGKLNIIGISDRKFIGHSSDETFLGYPVCAPEEIKDLNPDYVLVATKFYINIIEDLYYETLRDTKIKIKPLVKKPFWTLFKEIWAS